MMIEVVVGFGRIKLLMFTEHHECAIYAYLFLTDPDGYEGIAFQRWLADIKGKDEDIPWKKFIQ